MRRSLKWMAVLAALLCGLAFALPQERPVLVLAPEPGPEPTPVPTPEPTPEPTPIPTPEPTPSPAPVPGKRIALTFDDGPGPGTRRILRALDAVGGRATFFMLGNRVEEYAATVRAVAAQGSEIGTHSWSHPNLAKLSADGIRRQLLDSVRAIERVTGARPRLLRPPYGSVGEDLRKVSRDMGLAIVNWNVDPEDWRVQDGETIRRRILQSARDGAIVVCHDIYPETAAAMEELVYDLTERGYQLVTVSELLGDSAAGRVYYAG